MEPLLTIKDVAAQLQVSRAQVSILLSTGELKGIKIGRIWRIQPAELQAFLQRNTQETRKAQEVGAS